MQGLCIDSNTVLHALSSVKLPIPDTQPTNMWTVALFAAARKPKFCSQSFAHVLQLLFVSYFSTIHTHPPHFSPIEFLRVHPGEHYLLHNVDALWLLKPQPESRVCARTLSRSGFNVPQAYMIDHTSAHVPFPLSLVHLKQNVISTIIFGISTRNSPSTAHHSVHHVDRTTAAIHSIFGCICNEHKSSRSEGYVVATTFPIQATLLT